MGHYRSEMGYEAEDEKRVKEKEDRRVKLIDALQKEIDKKGVASVIADVIMGKDNWKHWNWM